MVWPICFIINMFAVLKGSQFYFLFSITAAGDVPCGDLKKSPRTSPMLQIIHVFFFWSYEISDDEKSELDTFSNQHLTHMYN